MPRVAKSDAELRKDSRVVYYEVSMYSQALLYFASSTRRTAFLDNAAVESFAIHVRGLVDFFWPRRGARTADLLATDFFHDDPRWAATCGTLPAVLDRARTRADKLVAHMTSRRSGVTKRIKSWPVRGIEKSLRPRLVRFFRDVEPMRLRKDVRTETASLRRRDLGARVLAQRTRAR